MFTKFGLETDGKLICFSCTAFSDESGDCNWELTTEDENVWLVNTREQAQEVAEKSNRAIFWGGGNSYLHPENPFVGNCRVVEIVLVVKG